MTIEPRSFNLPDLPALLHCRDTGRFYYREGSAALRRQLRTFIAGHDSVLQAWVEAMSGYLGAGGIDVSTIVPLDVQLIDLIVTRGLDALTDEMELVWLSLNPLGLAQLHRAVRSSEAVDENWIEAFADDDLGDGLQSREESIAAAHGLAPTQIDNAMPREVERAKTSPFGWRRFNRPAVWGALAAVLVLAAGISLLVPRHPRGSGMTATSHQPSPSPSRPFEFTSGTAVAPQGWKMTLENLKTQRSDPQKMLTLIYNLSDEAVKSEIDQMRRDHPGMPAQDILNALYLKFGKPADYDLPVTAPNQ